MKRGRRVAGLHPVRRGFNNPVAVARRMTAAGYQGFVLRDSDGRARTAGEAPSGTQRLPAEKEAVAAD